ncbi:MAG: hypothetical protein WC894_04300 [Patescibacteria group bacterium]
MKKILKVGFDMDGVILYNPIRFIRPIAKLLKPLKSFFLKQKSESFYFPKSKIEQFLFYLLHKTSFKIDPGIKYINDLVKAKKIKAYIITGRYSFLKKDYETWLKKINADSIFEKCYQNKDDLQPNEFKEKMIKKLNLDIYIEDNWDIVQKLKKSPLRQGYAGQVKVFWITNILDKNIPYQHKYKSLQEALQDLK